VVTGGKRLVATENETTVSAPRGRLKLLQKNQLLLQKTLLEMP